MKKEKIIVVPDVHGRNIWKEAAEKLENGEVDKMIFLGDYFDSHDIKGDTQIGNFQEIVSFKSSFPEQVTLLLGNHDIQYITGNPCSGYQAGKHYIIQSLLNPLISEGNVQMVKIIGEYLFVHAGVSKTWCEINNIRPDFLEDDINDLLTRDPYKLEFQRIPFGEPMRFYSNYGDNVWQSPTWIRPDSLVVDKIPGYIQVVGHTYVDKPILMRDVWFTDCHGNEANEKDKFLILEV